MAEYEKKVREILKNRTHKTHLKVLTNKNTIK